MRKHLLLLLATLGLLLAACCNTPQARMRAADAIIEADPDSALALLHAIDPADLTSASDSAYYALLLTQARIKTDTQPASDTLISRALAAYRFSPDPSLRTRAHFYAAQVAYRQRKYRDAMKNAVVAFDVASQTNDSYWIAKTAELLGDLYTIACNSAQAFRYTELSIAEYLKAGKVRNHRFALCDLASNYRSRGIYDSAYAIVDSVAEVAIMETPPDSALLNYAKRILIGIQCVTGDYSEMGETMQDYVHNPVELIDSLSYFTLESYAISCMGDSAAFENVIAEALDVAENLNDSLPLLYSQYCHYVAKKDCHNALMLSDSIIQMQARVTNELLDESYATIQGDYYESQNIIKSQQNEYLQRLVLIIVICSTVIFILLVFVFLLKLKATKADILANIAQLQTLKAIAVNNSQLIELLLKEKWRIVNKLCDIYYDKCDSEGMLKYIVHEIESEISELKTPGNINDIIETTDRCLDGIISKLKNECPFIKGNDVEFIGLIFSGLSVRAVCYVTGTKKDYYYKKKNRLLQKIMDSNAEHKDEFISRLSRFES
ncbi:MAG: hypothetical protein HDR45_05335 [Bacteroides sp.]|nr:hypothetical protein [Bacteroides sp.]